MTTSPTRRAFQILTLVGLLLIYWFTRLHALDSMALFLDEAYHLQLARLVWRLQPFHAASDGRLLNVWWIALFWPFNSAVWIARASSVTVATVGLACALAFANAQFSFRAAVAAGLLYVFLPLAFFFDRMALADTLSAPFAAGAVWAIGQSALLDSSGARTRSIVEWAALGGIALAAAVLSKISNVIFLCIPIFAAFTLFELSRWRRGLIAAASAYVGCFTTLAPLAWMLKHVAHSDLGLDLLDYKTQSAFAELPARIGSAALIVVRDVLAYAPFPMWLFVLVGMGIALWKGGRPAWLVGSVLIVTVGALVGRTSPDYLESRFLPVYAPFAAILAGSGLAWLSARWRPAWLVMAAVLTFAPGGIFLWQGWTDPTTLRLPDTDRWQYITGWPSGYGFREIADDMIARGEAAHLLTLDLGGQQRFDGYLFGRTTIVTAARYEPGIPLNNALLVIDTPKDDADLAALKLNLIEVAQYPRPGNESALVIYKTAP